jgi:hypothetical protein
LCTNDEISEKNEIKKAIPFPKIKYPGINLTKKVNDLHNENHKTLIKETEDPHTYTHKWRHTGCSDTRRINS